MHFEDTNVRGFWFARKKFRRAREVGLSGEFVRLLRDAGVNHLSALAFAVGQPGQPIIPAEGFLAANLGKSTRRELSSAKACIRSTNPTGFKLEGHGAVKR